MKLLSKVFALVMVLSLALPASVLAAAPVAPGTPTLLSHEAGWRTTDVKPLLKGLTQNNTEVAIYIDDVYNGQATVVNGDKGTASFAYVPFLNIGPGVHMVKAKAVDPRTNLESKVTRDHVLHVEQYNPTPTLQETVVNKNTTWAKPFITGVAKNDSYVHVYIDGEYNGQTKVENHSTGTADFAYQPFLDLKPGQHEVHVVAKDLRGKKSKVSETIAFNVVEPQTVTEQKQIKETAEVENTETVKEESKDVKEGESPDEPASEENTEETGEEEEIKEVGESESTSTLGWALLVLVAAGLVYRNRRSVKTFFSERNNQDKGGSGGSSDSSGGNVEVITKSSKDKEGPGSPPPASNF